MVILGSDFLTEVYHIGSMYGKFTHIYNKNQPNVGTVNTPYMDGMGMESLVSFARITFSLQFSPYDGNALIRDIMYNTVGLLNQKV